jgi:hypothetical protein
VIALRSGALATQFGHAQTVEARHERALYIFTDGTDGAYPYAGVIRDAKNNLYGTASFAGDSGNDGVVFKVDQSGKETCSTPLVAAAMGETRKLA